MNKGRHPFWPQLASLCLFAGLATPAFAAGPVEYHCNGDGVSWTSSRPCDASKRNEFRGMGNAPAAPSYDSAGLPTVTKAPEYLPYMSMECAQLNDAIRTGPSRGLKEGPMSELRADYQKRCSENEASARRQVQEAEKQQRERRDDQQAAAQAERSRSLLSADQCYEMLRILHGKRQRASSMNDGEKADLRLFEENYKTRCPRG